MVYGKLKFAYNDCARCDDMMNLYNRVSSLNSNLFSMIQFGTKKRIYFLILLYLFIFRNESYRVKVD